MKRQAGILLPISSLNGKYGIGSFGKEARKTIDAMQSAGFRTWQVLPLTPTGYGDSPYQSECGYAGNPYFIDLETLFKEKLLSKEELFLEERANNGRVDYGDLYQNRFAILRKAYGRFIALPQKKQEDFLAFCKQKKYQEYALYVTIKKSQNSRPWFEWDEPLKHHEKNIIAKFFKANQEEIGFYLFLQYTFFKQWFALKKYANEHGISIFGDLPLYLSRDSVEMWLHPELFQLDEAGNCKGVAGVPPDYFSATGQLWGNPLYDWEAQKKTSYRWWKNRIKTNLQLFDFLRIDHFRGLDRYYFIPYGETTAINGRWEEGPKTELFIGLKNAPIIAEDLGCSDASLEKFLKDAGYPGMRVASFMFDGNPQNTHLPQNYCKNCVAYTGTHDNEPLLDLYSAQNPDHKKWMFSILENACKQFEIVCKKTQSDAYYVKKTVELVLKSEANLAIIPFADFLTEKGLRINTPGLSNGKNWTVRIANQSRLFSAIKKYASIIKEAKR